MAKPKLAEKDVLNPDEAIRYWDFSRRKFLKFIHETDGGDFLVYYGTRRLIIRIAFEEYLFQNPQMKEVLANGESRQRTNKA